MKTRIRGLDGRVRGSAGVKEEGARGAGEREGGREGGREREREQQVLAWQVGS